MSDSSYVELPEFINRKQSTINPQNIAEQCFKWTALAKHVTDWLFDKYKYCVRENYKKHEDKYNFYCISFPTPLSDIPKFEKNNKTVSVNVYGLEKKISTAAEVPDVRGASATCR